MDDGYVARAMAKRKITREQAIESIRNWWSGFFIAHDLNRQALITECQLIYVPFWKLWANVTCSVMGFEYGDECGISRNIDIRQAYVWTWCACDVRRFGLKYLRNPEVETEPYDQHLGSVEYPTISMKNAMAHGLSSIERKVLNAIPVMHIIYKEINVEPLQVMLIYYPIWSIKYSYFEQKFWATVDGVTGNILAGRAPADLRLKRRVLSSGAIIAILVAVLSLWILYNISLTVAPLLLIAIVVVCLTVIWAAFAFYCSDPDIVIEEFGQKPRYYDGPDRFILDDLEAVKKDSIKFFY